MLAVVLALAVSFSAAMMDNPVMIFPGFTDSWIYGSVRNLTGPSWVCERDLNDTLFWHDPKWDEEPLADCYANYLTTVWNDTWQKPWNKPETTIHTIDFGGWDGMNLHGLFQKFIDNGYVLGTDIFGLPYDWRLHPASLDIFFREAIQLIERTYNASGGHKISLIGDSFGTRAVHWLLTETGVSQAWKDTHIKKIVLIEPAYGGAIAFLNTIWTGQSGPDSPTRRLYWRSMPGEYGLFPNGLAWGDSPVILGPNSEVIKARELHEFLNKMGKIPDPAKKIYDFVNERVVMKEMIDPGVDSLALMNTALNTPIMMTFNSSWDDKPGFQYGPGDGLLDRTMLEWSCNNWKAHTAVCHDYLRSDSGWGHGPFARQPEVIKDVYEAVVGDEWRIGGNAIVRGRDMYGRKNKIRRTKV
jgi:hypothetical protein